MHDIRRAWIYIICGAVLGVAAAFLFLMLAVPHYAARMVLEPANPMAGSEVSSVLANDDDLTSLKYLIQQVSVPNTADFMRFETMVRGPAVAAEMLKDPEITKHLPRRAAQSAQSLSEYIQKRVRIEPIGQTPQRRLTYLNPDPDFAVSFLTMLHKVTDELIRRNIAEAAVRRVKFLDDSLKRAANPDHRRSITYLLMEQERAIMLVTMDQPFAASIIEPAAASSKPEWPDKKLVLAGFVLVGALLGFVLYGLRHGGA